MRRLLVALIATAVTACTPAQVAAFKTLTPAQQRKVVDALQEPRDCYSALRWFSGSHAKARQVIWRESRNQPAARNPRSSAAGCWQLLGMHDWRYSAVGCSPSQKLDPVCNTKAADHLFRQAGWSPWGLA